MSDINDLIREYRKEADRLWRYRKRLLEEKERERDVEKLKLLELRIQTLEDERRELIEDAASMSGYGEDWRGKDKICADRVG